MNRITTAALTAVTVTTLGLSVAAVHPSVASAEEGEPGTMTGTWIVRVVPNAGPAPFESTISFERDGTLVEATSRGLVSAGLGIWRENDEGRVSVAFSKYRFDAQGTFTGKITIHEVGQVSSDGQSYDGQATSVITNPAGQQVASFSSTSHATRMH